MVKLKVTNGWVVACMNCHGQLGTEVNTYKQALKECKTHLSVTEKPHGDHTMTITPTKLVRKQK